MNWTMSKRTEVGKLREDLQVLEEKYNVLNRWHGSNLSVTDVLSLASMYVGSFPDSASAVNMLKHYEERGQNDLAFLRRQIEDLRAEIDRAYESFPKLYSYELHAILVHSGSPDLGGHYWAYIRDHASNQWFKFNDVTVTKVDNVEETMVQSFGDNVGATSAYALMYVRTGQGAVAWNDQEGVQSWARSIVEDDNGAFRRELDNWKGKPSPSGAPSGGAAGQGEKVEVFLNEVTKVKNSLSELGVVFHNNCTELYHYAQMRNVDNRMLNMIIGDFVYQKLYNDHLVDFRKDPVKLGLLMVMQVDPDPRVDEIDTMIRLKNDFDEFIKALRILAQALRSFSKKDWFPAASCFAFVNQSFSPTVLAGAYPVTQAGLKKCAKRVVDAVVTMLQSRDATSSSPSQVFASAHIAWAVTRALPAGDLKDELFQKWRTLFQSTENIPKNLSSHDHFVQIRAQVFENKPVRVPEPDSAIQRDRASVLTAYREAYQNFSTQN